MEEGERAIEKYKSACHTERSRSATRGCMCRPSTTLGMTHFVDHKEALIQKGSVTFAVRVHPGARTTQIKGVMADGTIKIDIAAAPEDGKANAALIVFLAEEFGVAKSHVEIISGETSRRKLVKICVVSS